MVDGLIDFVYYVQVGAHVGAKFLVGVPVPEEMLVIDCGFEEVRLALEDLGIVQLRWSDFIFFVHFIDGMGPGEMVDIWTMIIVFCMICVELEIEGEGSIFGLVF